MIVESDKAQDIKTGFTHCIACNVTMMLPAELSTEAAIRSSVSRAVKNPQLLLIKWIWICNTVSYCCSSPKYLTPRNTLFLDKPIVVQQVKKLPLCYRTRRSITALLSSRNWILSHQIYLRSFLILSLLLGLDLKSSFLLSCFLTKMLNAFLVYPVRATCSRPSHSQWFYHRNNFCWSSHSFPLCSSLQPPFISSLLILHITIV
jgi:hypothetical protein